MKIYNLKNNFQMKLISKKKRIQILLIKCLKFKKKIMKNYMNLKIKIIN